MAAGTGRPAKTVLGTTSGEAAGHAVVTAWLRWLPHAVLLAGFLGSARLQVSVCRGMYMCCTARAQQGSTIPGWLAGWLDKPMLKDAVISMGATVGLAPGSSRWRASSCACQLAVVRDGHVSSVQHGALRYAILCQHPTGHVGRAAVQHAWGL